MQDTTPPADPARVANSGISGLDAVLGGGLPRQRMYLLEGTSGSGKTTFGLQFALAGAAQDERVLYITLSETEEEIRASAASHGWDLAGVTIVEVMLDDELLDPDQQYDIFDPADIEMGEQMQNLRQAIDQHDPQRLVIDSLSGLRLLAADSLRHRRQVEGLRRFLRGRDCTTLLLDEILDEPGDPQPRSLVHGILTLQEEMLEYGTSRQRLRITKMRGIPFPRTWHDYRIVTGGIEVYPHLIAAQHHNHRLSGPAASGIEALDKLLDGGLARGRITLLMGPAGTGKSSLMMQQYVAAAVRREERCLVYLFNETVESVLERGQTLGLDLKAQAEAGNLLITKIDPNETSPGEFAWRIRQEVEEHEAQMVVLDSISGYLNAMPEQRFLPLHVHELLTYLSNQGCVTLMSMGESSLMNTETASSIDLSTLADTVLLLRFMASDQGPRPLLCAVKHRAGHQDARPHELHFTDRGLTLGPPHPQVQGLFQGLVAFESGEPAPQETDGEG